MVVKGGNRHGSHIMARIWGGRLIVLVTMYAPVVSGLSLVYYWGFRI